MPTSGIEDGAVQYSRFTGFVYIFNLIVGTGALTLPAAFHDAGWALSTGVLIMLAFMSYLTTTFMIESMASANAIIKFRRIKSIKRADSISRARNTTDDDSDEDLEHQNQRGVQSSGDPISNNEEEPLLSRDYLNLGHDVSGLQTDDNDVIASRQDSSGNRTGPGISGTTSDDSDVTTLIRRSRNQGGHRDSAARINSPIGSYYNISEIIEMGKMATLFFNKIGRTLFYLCIAIYLYGDLAIYAAAVSKSLRDVACTYKPDNTTSNTTIDSLPCWAGSAITRIDAYRVALAVFVGVGGPFGFCNVSKTKYLQMLTTLMRWFAFGAMITLACVRLAGGVNAHPDVARLSGIPNLFGVCVYSFMCHHSLPSLVTPINRKRSINWLIASDFMLVLMFYVLLAFTGIFAFEHLNDLYTLNFQPTKGEPWYLAVIHYFLSLFPVFTLSTNFPIIMITLRNNLKALFLTEGRRYSWWTRSCVFPLMAIVPPVAVAFVTNSLEFLVGITGSYAGAGIQYVVPAFLVYYSRKSSHELVGPGIVNHHSSWFKSTFWVIFVQAWALGCVVLVTWNHIATAAS